MDAGAVTRALLALAAGAPWLSLLPSSGVLEVLAHTIAVLAAFHGAGRCIGYLARVPDAHPLLVVQWGASVVIGASGVALLFGADTSRFQTAIVYVGAGAHTAVLALRLRTASPLPRLGIGPWVVPAALLVVLGAFHVLGAAGDVGANPFDADGHVPAQLQRLRDTGVLGDALGYARSSQLGGQLALDAFATLPDDVRAFGMLEALAFALALGLAIAMIGAHDATRALWSTLLVVVGSALTFVPRDSASCWTAVGMILALHVMLAAKDRRLLLPIAVTAGALATLHHELVPIGVVALGAAVVHARPTARELAGPACAAFAIVVPFVLSRSAANIPSGVHALVFGHAGGGALRVLIVVATIGIALLASSAARGARWRWLVIAAIAVFATMLTAPHHDHAYALRFVWPLAIAAGAIACIEVARSEKLTLGAMTLALAAVVLIQAGRDATGRRRWTRRYLDLADDITFVRTHRDGAEAVREYDALTARIPRGAVVAVWVMRPEQLDYRGDYQLVDLRTPRVAHLRTHGYAPHVSKLEQLLAGVGARYLLVEADDQRGGRIRADVVARLLCSSPSVPCADDLEVLALRHPVVASERGVALIDLSGLTAAPH